MRFAGAIILAVASLSHFAALRLFADAGYLKTFQADQLHTLALLALKLHGDGYAISLVFVSFACLSPGYLVFRSGFLPSTIGALMAIAAVRYLFNSSRTSWRLRSPPRCSPRSSCPFSSRNYRSHCG